MRRERSRSNNYDPQSNNNDHQIIQESDYLEGFKSKQVSKINYANEYQSELNFGFTNEEIPKPRNEKKLEPNLKIKQAIQIQKQATQQQRQMKVWTQKEDLELNRLYQIWDGNWKKISQKMIDRNPSQCCQRWRRMNPQKIRNMWTGEEDQKLLALVDQYGQNWGVISSNMDGRSGKQVRQRYINKLDPFISRDKWTLQEDLKIYKLFLERGPKWCEISQYFTGRPENSVKNRYYSYIQQHLDETKPENNANKIVALHKNKNSNNEENIGEQESNQSSEIYDENDNEHDQQDDNHSQNSQSRIGRRNYHQYLRTTNVQDDLKNKQISKVEFIMSLKKIKSEAKSMDYPFKILEQNDMSNDMDDDVDFKHYQQFQNKQIRINQKIEQVDGEEEEKQNNWDEEFQENDMYRIQINQSQYPLESSRKRKNEFSYNRFSEVDDQEFQQPFNRMWKNSIEKKSNSKKKIKPNNDSGKVLLTTNNVNNTLNGLKAEEGEEIDHPQPQPKLRINIMNVDIGGEDYANGVSSLLNYSRNINNNTFTKDNVKAFDEFPNLCTPIQKLKQTAPISPDQNQQPSSSNFQIENQLNPRQLEKQRNGNIIIENLKLRFNNNNSIDPESSNNQIKKTIPPLEQEEQTNNHNGLVNKPKTAQKFSQNQQAHSQLFYQQASTKSQYNPQELVQGQKANFNNIILNIQKNSNQNILGTPGAVTPSNSSMHSPQYRLSSVELPIQRSQNITNQNSNDENIDSSSNGSNQANASAIIRNLNQSDIIFQQSIDDKSIPLKRQILELDNESQFKRQFNQQSDLPLTPNPYQISSNGDQSNNLEENYYLKNSKLLQQPIEPQLLQNQAMYLLFLHNQQLQHQNNNINNNINNNNNNNNNNFEGNSILQQSSPRIGNNNYFFNNLGNYENFNPYDNVIEPYLEIPSYINQLNGQGLNFPPMSPAIFTPRSNQYNNAINAPNNNYNHYNNHNNNNSSLFQPNSYIPVSELAYLNVLNQNNFNISNANNNNNNIGGGPLSSNRYGSASQAGLVSSHLQNYLLSLQNSRTPAKKDPGVQGNNSLNIPGSLNGLKGVSSQWRCGPGSAFRPNSSKQTADDQMRIFFPIPIQESNELLDQSEVGAQLKAQSQGSQNAKDGNLEKKEVLKKTLPLKLFVQPDYLHPIPKSPAPVQIGGLPFYSSGFTGNSNPYHLLDQKEYGNDKSFVDEYLQPSQSHILPSELDSKIKSDLHDQQMIHFDFGDNHVGDNHGIENSSSISPNLSNLSKEELLCVKSNLEQKIQNLNLLIQNKEIKTQADTYS